MGETVTKANETSHEPPQDHDPYATVAPAPGELFPTLSQLAGDRFRILRPLARGGLGEVFVAHDCDLGREVALKEIQDRYAHHPDSRARFLLEAEVTGRLEHPGIVPIYGMGQYPDGRPYYAMRLIRGETLQEAITRFHAESAKGLDIGERILALRRLLGRFIEICRTINYAHGQSVLHRDLKPANVMLGPHGEVLVVDWGLAKVIGGAETPRVETEAGTGPELTTDSSMTQAGLSIGTPAYMSPEQAGGDLARIGPASDIYSLGAILYQLLTGRNAIEGKTLVEVLDRVKKGEFPRPRKVDRKLPRTLEAICVKAMALKPEDRYQSAQILAEDLERWMADEPTSARRELFPFRLWRWSKRRPALAAYLVILGSLDFLFLFLISLVVAQKLTTINMIPYASVAYALAELFFGIPLIAILVSQFPMALGAMIGGLIGLPSGRARITARKGAWSGLRIGLILGVVLAVFQFVTSWNKLVSRNSSEVSREGTTYPTFP